LAKSLLLYGGLSPAQNGFLYSGFPPSLLFVMLISCFSPLDVPSFSSTWKTSFLSSHRKPYPRAYPLCLPRREEPDRSSGRVDRVGCHYYSFLCIGFWSKNNLDKGWFYYFRSGLSSPPTLSCSGGLSDFSLPPFFPSFFSDPQFTFGLSPPN